MKAINTTLLAAAFALGDVSADCVGDACGDWGSSVWQCANGINYLWEGTWADDNYWSWGSGNTLTWLTKSEMTELHAEWRKVDFELGDIQYRTLYNGGSFGEWHTEILDGVKWYEVPVHGPEVVGYPSVGCQGSNCSGDATLKHTYALDVVDFHVPTYTLHDRIEASITNFSAIWAGQGNKLYRGTRVPSTYSLTKANRNAIVATAASVENHDIDYTWSDMMENKWDFFGGYDWDGSVADIDEIRCDGVAEYAYERNGFRVWGTNSLWNSGSGNDDALDSHNELWEHAFGYDLAELSPVIQGGCGGYGDGARTTLRDRAAASPPKIGNVTVTRTVPDPMSPWSFYYTINISEIYDNESNKVYVTLENERSPGYWDYAYDLSTGSWMNRSWTGSAGVPISIRIDNSGPYVPNQKWRVVAIDQGGNSSIVEVVGQASFSGTGDFKEYYAVADADGIYKYKLQGIPAGSDFDVSAYDDSHGGALIATGSNGGNQNENLEFFAQNHTKIRFRVYSYAGGGGYNFGRNGFDKATMYDISTLHLLKSGNSFQETVAALPASNGWAIAWGSVNGGANDVDMQILNASNAVIGSSTSSAPTEYVRGNFAGNKLKVYQYNPGTYGSYRIFKID
jgi:hypothetical protein